MIRRTFLALTLLAVLGTAGSAAHLKALIITGQDAAHAWDKTAPMLQSMLEETGLFEVDVYTSPPKGGDMSKFQPTFEGYDVVVMNYGFDGDSWPDKVNQAFEKYVREGGGLVIFHAADNAFPEWKEYNEMIGVGGWGGRNEKDGPYLRWRDGKIVRDMTPGVGGSHGPQHEYALEVREPNHPITQGLPSKFMHTADELYNRLRGPAKNVTVLTTSFSPKDKGGTGEHEPTLMTIDYGKGRVFHTVLGHGPKQLKSVAFIVTFGRGTEWAATGKVTQDVPEDMPTAERSRER
jgi:uncharacterized protein